MTLKSLNKAFLFDKALKKTRLTRPQIFVLYTVHIVAPGRYRDIFDSLMKVNRTTGSNYLYRYLGQLIENGLVTRTGFIYEITPAGTEALKDAEKRLRVERHDR
ncbi:MAG: hypothetical protein ACTHM5_03800 [Ginsengibacter sp.]